MKSFPLVARGLTKWSSRNVAFDLSSLFPGELPFLTLRILSRCSCQQSTERDPPLHSGKPPYGGDPLSGHPASGPSPTSRGPSGGGSWPSSRRLATGVEYSSAFIMRGQRTVGQDRRSAGGDATKKPIGARVFSAYWRFAKGSCYLATTSCPRDNHGRHGRACRGEPRKTETTVRFDSGSETRPCVPSNRLLL